MFGMVRKHVFRMFGGVLSVIWRLGSAWEGGIGGVVTSEGGWKGCWVTENEIFGDFLKIWKNVENDGK